MMISFADISSILPIPITSCRVINGTGRIDREKLNAIVRQEKVFYFKYMQYCMPDCGSKSVCRF